MRRFSLVLIASAALMGGVSAQAVVEPSVDRSDAIPSSSAVEDATGHRRLFNVWSVLFLLNPHDCPPFGKPHEDCIQRQNAAANGGGSGGGSDGSTSSSSSSSSNGGDGSGGSSSSSSAASTSNGSNSANSTTQGFFGSRFSWLMLVAAALAAAMAMAAIYVGQGKGTKSSHALQGSVGRRMGLFSNFANKSALSGGTERPQRVVEMTMSGDDGAKYSGMV
ncbi:hypothetical protein MPSEU_000771500 [Mayamaea pseudoterrestris]|nr:hypothetical protein MPSEU_000771500 [Mayamaea pseudoterrestris]